MTNIFADNATKYWDLGLPAIPLIAGQKRPAITRWQMFADRQPTHEERAVWLESFPNGNIGMPMGAASGLVAIDIDTDDETVLAVLDRVLPFSPFERVGKKGFVRLYRWSGERTARIKHEDGSMICEVLSKGTQVVLPPSIHPETLSPYTSNASLYDVLSQVQPLPPEFDKVLRQALREVGIEVAQGSQGNKITTFVPAGARDNQMVWHAGLLARAVLRGERSLMQALGEMDAWINNFVEKIVGDEITAEKGQKKVIEFMIRDLTSERRTGLPVGWDEDLTDEDKERMGLTFTEDMETWPASRVLEYLTIEFDRHPDNKSEGRMNAVNVALDRIARSVPSMSVLDEGRILRFIHSQSKGLVSQVDLKKQLVVLRRGDIAGENHKELAAAAIQFLDTFGEVRFDAGQFWQWRGAFWEHLEEATILKVIAEQYGQYPACRRQSDHMGIVRVMRALAAKELRSSYITGVNFANGFLTENLDLVEHDPDYGMTYVLPYRYRPDKAGHMPMFDQFLNDSWGDDPDYGDKLLALQEIMGATLMGKAPVYQRAVCLFGQPGSGKSRVTAILKGLLPERSTASVVPHDWADRFLPAQLFGKVMNFAGELSESKAIPGDIFKKVVSGEELMAQHKNQAPFEFKPACAHWFSSNHLPKTRDSSDGFNRRWLLLEWNKRVDPNKIIRDLDQLILENEREAIVAWAVQGYARLAEAGNYTEPSSHLALIDQMANDNNSVRAFLTSVNELKFGPEYAVPMEALHTEYWKYCLAVGVTARAPLIRFAKLMKELGPVFEIQEEVRVGNKKFYRGVGYGNASSGSVSAA